MTQNPMVTTLNTQQQDAISYIMKEMASCHMNTIREYRGKFEIIISGYAGTGKTTLLAFLRDEIRKTYQNLTVSFVTFTGKASSVLKNKLESYKINLGTDKISTIHSLIYKPIVKWDKRLKTYVVVGWELKHPDELYTDLIIIDEGSMVSSQLWSDLKSFNLPIIVMGDHGQLPPVGDNFNLMRNPILKLTEIHRQALNSPIIQLSKFVRDYGYIPPNRIFSNNVFKLSWKSSKCKEIWDKIQFDENVITLCAFNSTRVDLNNKIRGRLGYGGEMPLPGERVVCLQNNNNLGIMNGQIATLVWLMPEQYKLYRMTLYVDDCADPLETIVSDRCFGQVTYTMYDNQSDVAKKQNVFSKLNNIKIDYFDFGYAMSVHKSQGSEWDKVILFEQRTSRWDDQYYARWLYTGITRSREKLFIINDYWG